MSSEKLYLPAVFLLCCLTISSVGGAIVGYCTLFFVPYGFRSLILTMMMCLLAGIVYVESERRAEIRARLWSVGMLWLPWITYLFIRTELSPLGVWKFEAYIMRVFAPCLVAVILYTNNPRLFGRYFINCLLGINVVLALCAPIIPDAEELYDVSIWVSRGIAVSVFLLFVRLEWNRKLLISIPLSMFFIGVMVFIGSRGPLLSLIITLMLYSLMRFRNKVVTIPLVAYSVFLLICSLLFIPAVQGKVESFLTHDHKNQMEIGDFADGRMAMLAPTCKIVKDNPLFGVGLGNWGIGFIQTFISDKSYVHFDYKARWSREFYYWPHNILVEILCELGLVGVILFGMLFYPFRHLCNPRNNYNYLVVMGLLFASTSSSIEGNAAPMIFSTLACLSGHRPQQIPGEVVLDGVGNDGAIGVDMRTERVLS